MPSLSLYYISSHPTSGFDFTEVKFPEIIRKREEYDMEARWQHLYIMFIEFFRLEKCFSKLSHLSLLHVNISGNDSNKAKHA